MVITYRITEGPSKFDLMSSLFDGKIVQFTQQIDKNRKTLKVSVVSVEKEDGSPDSWNIKIYVVESDSSIPVEKIYSAYYNSRTRQGSINLGI